MQKVALSICFWAQHDFHARNACKYIDLWRISVSESRSQFRVFVVDDEFIIASTLATILQRNGFEAVSFTDPLEALSAAGQSAPDLLITDVVMPALSGVDLAISIKKLSPECKVLLFSGQAATANLLQAARSNGHDFELLSKPIHPTDLLKKIRNVTEEALL
jgi:DNA-binding NtrC family response regulator